MFSRKGQIPAFVGTFQMDFHPDGRLKRLASEQGNLADGALALQALQAHLASQQAASATPAPTPAPIPLKSSILLSKAIEDFKLDMFRIVPKTGRAQKGWDSAKAALERPPHLQTLLDLLGDGEMSAIDRITTEDAWHRLQMLPPNWRKSPATKALTIQEIVEKQSQALEKYKTMMTGLAQDERESIDRDIYVKMLGESTCNNYVWTWGDFFEWCVRKEYVSRNHAEGLAIARDKTTSFRRGYTLDELKILFESPYYAKHQYDDPYKYWVPMLMLYSGGRLNEFCQLCVTDIVTVEDIPCILIRADEFSGQRLKNAESKRSIPIHSQLINAGFLDYVETMRLEKSRKLFPTLDKGKEKHSKLAGNWFNRHLATEKIKVRGLDNHSFRHTAISTWLNAKVSERLAAAIAGQGYGGEASEEEKNKGVTYDIYGKVKMTTLQPVVEMLEFGLKHPLFKMPVGKLRQ